MAATSGSQSTLLNHVLNEKIASCMKISLNCVAKKSNQQQATIWTNVVWLNQTTERKNIQWNLNQNEISYIETN